MNFPMLQSLSVKEETRTKFSGFYGKTPVPDGAFSQLENISGESTLGLHSRPPRGQVPLDPFQGFGGILSKNHLWVTQQSDLVAIDPEKGHEVTRFEGVFTQPPQLVSFSSYLVDMVSGQWFSTLPGEDYQYASGSFAYSVTGSRDNFSVYLCDQEGNPLFPGQFGATAPENPIGGLLWFDTTATPGVLKRYYEDSASYTPEDTFLHITLPGVTCTAMEKGDYITLSLPQVTDQQGVSYGVSQLDTPKTVVDCGVTSAGNCYFVVKGSLDNCLGYHTHQGTLSVELSVTSTQGFTLQPGLPQVENPIPVMDFLVEAGNRLWGCRYGENRKGEWVNEIYASALGSFRVWEKFEGIADDSYALSCGTDGPFTAAGVYGGYPLFFKEGCIHRVYGEFPFSVTPVVCHGVKAGCAGGLCQWGNRLYYPSPAGLCQYTGSLPSVVDLPYTLPPGPVLGAAGDKACYFYFSQPETPILLVYHPKSGLLTMENPLNFVCLCSHNQQVYGLVEQQNGFSLFCLTGCQGAMVLEQPVGFMATTGPLFMNLPKGGYVQGLSLGLHLPKGSTLQVSLQYNSQGGFTPPVTLQGVGTGHITLPLRICRCDHVRIRLQGTGPFTLHSLTKRIGEGGHIGCK